MRKLYVTTSLDDISTNSAGHIKDVIKKSYEIVGELNKDSHLQDTKKDLIMSDIVVGICMSSSTRLGYEVAVALEKYSKPTIVLVQEGCGIHDDFLSSIKHPMYTIKTYKVDDDILSLIQEKEAKHFKPLSSDNVCETDVCAV